MRTRVSRVYSDGERCQSCLLRGSQRLLVVLVTSRSHRQVDVLRLMVRQSIASRSTQHQTIVLLRWRPLCERGMAHVIIRSTVEQHRSSWAPLRVHRCKNTSSTYHHPRRRHKDRTTVQTGLPPLPILELQRLRHLFLVVLNVVGTLRDGVRITQCEQYP